MPHLLLQASGKYRDPSLEAESWTCTARIALVFGGGVDDVAPLPTWSPQDATESTIDPGRVTDSNYNISDGGNTFSPTDFLHDQGEAAWKAIFLAATGIASQAWIHKLALYPIGTNGLTMETSPGVKAVAASVYESTYAGMSGSNGNSNGPMTVSTCVSWQSRISGKRGRGRMYLPYYVAGVSLGLFHPTDQANVATAGVDFGAGLELNNVGGISTALIVTGHPWTSYGRVTQVRSGRVPDTQRRRDAQLQEQYVSLPM